MIKYVVQEYLCYILFYSVRLHYFQRIIFFNLIYKRNKLGGTINRVMWTPKVIHVLIPIMCESVSCEWSLKDGKGKETETDSPLEVPDVLILVP